jgi:hypothetical protein
MFHDISGVDLFRWQGDNCSIIRRAADTAQFKSMVNTARSVTYEMLKQLKCTLCTQTRVG